MVSKNFSLIFFPVLNKKKYFFLHIKAIFEIRFFLLPLLLLRSLMLKESSKQKPELTITTKDDKKRKERKKTANNKKKKTNKINDNDAESRSMAIIV